MFPKNFYQALIIIVIVLIGFFLSFFLNDFILHKISEKYSLLILHIIAWLISITSIVALDFIINKKNTFVIPKNSDFRGIIFYMVLSAIFITLIIIPA